MAVFQCKMCGASLTYKGRSIVTCEYCDTQQTIPTLTSEQIANLHDRANMLKKNSSSEKTGLLKRAYMFLEDEDWSNADAYCEKVLDVDPENAYAYLGKLMAELQVQNHKALPNLQETFDDRVNYQKAFRFADEKLKALLAAYNQGILDRKETERYESIYNKACSLKASGRQFGSITYYQSAISRFELIPEWEDSQEQILACRKEIDKLKQKESTQKKTTLIAIASLAVLACAIIAVISVWKSVIIPSRSYKEASALMAEANYGEAIELFEGLDGYKDSNKQLLKCYEQYCTQHFMDIVSLGLTGSVNFTLYDSTYYQASLSVVNDTKANFTDFVITAYFNDIPTTQEIDVWKAGETWDLTFLVPVDLLQETTELSLSLECTYEDIMIP